MSAVSEGDISEYGFVEEKALLLDQCDIVTKPVETEGIDVPTIDRDMARARTMKPSE